MNTTITKSATVERAREVIEHLRNRNKLIWDEIDRETVFAMNALINDAERLRHSLAEEIRARGFDAP